MTRPIRRLLILGGGTAGRLAAAYRAHCFGAAYPNGPTLRSCSATFKRDSSMLSDHRALVEAIYAHADGAAPRLEAATA